MVRLDKKVQLEILDEVSEKSYSGKPIEIVNYTGQYDASKAHNFAWLRDKAKCFVYSTRVEQETRYFPDGTSSECGELEIPRYLSGLSKEGREYREILAVEVKEEQRKEEQIELLRKQVKAAVGANVRSTIAMILSGIASLISLYVLCFR